jgi:predicted ATPase/class 3 adenylate cyclase/DNA-binding CsgD family transcriptional regulator
MMTTVDQATGLPTGTVTFLLTDVEGSTRLWDADPVAAAAAIDRHRQLIADAVAAANGSRPLEQGEGDSTVSAFARATDAAAAAQAAQRALADEPWPGGRAIRVRMAIHTGEAEPAPDRTYAGAVLNRCARLRALAHGGQVLVSGATADLVAEHLDGDLHLSDLGSHRLRDLSRPERVWQLGGPGIEGDHPRLRSLDNTPNNLPVQLSSFIGREEDIAQGVTLLAQARVLTFTGAGGCGKTRLAQRVAGEVVDRFDAGVWWIELAALAEPELVAEAVARTMSLHVPPERRALDVLADRLGEDRVLLVLDNCEHVIGAVADLAHHIQLACPAVSMLATSREPLGLEGEVTWRVPSLELPPTQGAGLETVTQYDAVRLFVDRAVQARPNFRVDNDNAPAVAQICHRLDGIPLAIELAAARTRSLPPERIAAELSDRFRLLSGGSRVALPRQQTLFGSVDWSHELLEPAERVVLRRLSVFAGGFGLDAAEAVVAADPVGGYEVLGLLGRLVDKSLVQVDDESGGAARYRLLETIRQYAGDRLADTGEVTSTRDRHLAWALAFAEQHESGATNAHLDVLDLLDADHANLRTALEWSIDAGHSDESVRLVGMLGLFWAQRGHYAEAAVLGPRAIEASTGRADPGLVARARWACAYVRFYGGDLVGAYGDATSGLDAAMVAGDQQATARCHHILGACLICVDPAETRRLLAIAADIAAAIGDEWCRADALEVMGFALIVEGRLDEGMALVNEGYEISRPLGNLFQEAWCHAASALSSGGRGDLSTALAAGRAAVETARRLGDPGTELWIASGYAALLFEVGDLAALDQLVDHYRGRREEWGMLGSDALLPSLVALTTVVDDPGTSGETLLAIGDGLAEAMDVNDAGLRWVVAALAALATGEPEEAARRAARCEVMEAFPVPRAAGSLVQAMAVRAGASGDAEALAHQALAAYETTDYRLGVPWALAVLGGIALDAGAFVEGTRVLAAADQAGSRMGRRRVWVEEAAFDADVARARKMLGDEFDATWAEGVALDVDEAVSYITRARGERGRPSFGWDSLTRTELACIDLVAEGLTNPQIGERLFIGRGTVKTHLTHVFAKLGVRSRAELASLATQRAGLPKT